MVECSDALLVRIECTCQSQVIESERCLGAWIQEAFFPFATVLYPCDVTDDGLKEAVTRRDRMKESEWRLTWWSASGTSTRMNCARLYSRRAGRRPSSRISSSLTMTRTSTHHPGVSGEYEQQIEGERANR